MYTTPRTAARGFTLVEILVVIAIIGLLSAVALPLILPALGERRVSESARILQAVLAGARDAAIRANAPRGIRLLPDPVLSPFGTTPGVLASNRVVPIEPAPNYSEGLVNLLVSPPPSGQIIVAEVLYSNYPNDYSSTTFPAVTPPSFTPIQANPTSWYWNIRQGDKIRFHDSGPYYTVAGPMAIGPNVDPNSSYANWQNPERYINNGPPNSTFPRTSAEYLILVNGVDDDENGYVDDAFDGLDNNGDGIVDPLYNGLDDDNNGTVDDEFPQKYGASTNPEGLNEIEKFDGTLATSVGVTNPGPIPQNGLQRLTNIPYTIYRRPVVTPGARETTLPAGVVVDLTTWNASSYITKTSPTYRPERSRLPVDPYSYYVDIMIAPNGQVVLPGAGVASGNLNTQSPVSSMPFYHFWLTDREGVVAPFPTGGTSPPPFLLPMPKETPGYPPAKVPLDPPPYLAGDRRLLTLFVKTGQIVSNSIEYFNINDTNTPFYDAQTGIKETQ